MYNFANVKMWTGNMQVESPALDQIKNLAQLPILAGPIAIMPDVHMGVGATVGSVIATQGAIIPAAVGVDIGCGMCALHTNLKASDLPIDLRKIRSDIEAVVPVGFNSHIVPVSILPNLHKRRVDLQNRFNKLTLLNVQPIQQNKSWIQLGTLGGGNHFIELCLDQNQDVWVMLHSGSRNIGKTIGEIAINMAKELAIRDKTNLVDKNLAWLPDNSVQFNMYFEALSWAQEYASLNRDIMMYYVLMAMKKTFPQVEGKEVTINCHHNYAVKDLRFGQNVYITRKGAVNADLDELRIIPGSMGAKSFIVRGLGNKDSYFSCSHGAGRKMSRSQAKKTFSLNDLANQTSGVECRKDSGIIDEIPGAYKDIDAVMEAQKDLVQVVHTLKQVLCIKG